MYSGYSSATREFTKQQQEPKRELHFAKFVVIRMPSLEETKFLFSHCGHSKKTDSLRCCENVSTTEKDGERKWEKNQFSQL